MDLEQDWEQQIGYKQLGNWMEGARDVRSGNSTGVVGLKRCANDHANVFLWLCIKKALIRHFSPTAIAFGFSAIVKVSGQNCFRTLCGSVRLGPPKSSAERSTKVLPRFHQGSASFVVSVVLWGRLSWAATKVPARVYQGCTKVLQVLWRPFFSGTAAK